MPNNKKSLYNKQTSVEVRRIIINISKKIKLNLSEYNLDQVHNYTCNGDDLMGYRNVVITNIRSGNRHFLVSNNTYEVWEYPKLTNNISTTPETGSFLVLFHNIHFDYYIIAKMTHSEKIIKNYLSERVKYRFLVKFGINYWNATVPVPCLIEHKPVTYGNNDFAKFFDQRGKRMRAYRLSKYKVIQRNIKNKLY